jgi:uncharacterized protein (TIGR02145 family)
MRNLHGFSIAILLIIFMNSCKKEKQVLPSVPLVSTKTISELSYTSALSGGNVSNEGDSPISFRGVCWSTSTDPTVYDDRTIESGGLGVFDSKMIGLIPNTTYYVRAYASNSSGISYGNSQVFSTLNYGTVSDIDGNLYKTVTIGTQTWMKENLRTTKYLNGNLIGTTISPTQDISNENAPQYQWAYGGNESNVANYGRLYTWYAVTDSRNLCPAGWHIPTYSQWTTLLNFLGGETIAGGKMKESGTIHWLSPNNFASDESNYTGLPGGSRYYDGTFQDLGKFATWWSATESSAGIAWGTGLSWYISDGQRAYGNKKVGFSVRCVKD